MIVNFKSFDLSTKAKRTVWKHQHINSNILLDYTKIYTPIAEILRNFIAKKPIAPEVASLLCPRPEFPAAVLLNDDFLMTQNRNL